VGAGIFPSNAEALGFGTPGGVVSGTQSAVATAGTPTAPLSAGASTGSLSPGAPAWPLAGGAPSGTEALGGGPGGVGDAAEGRTASGPVTSESGTGSGGQAIAQGGAGRASQDGVGKGTVGGVAITTPLNGHTLSPDEPPIVIVRGNVQNVDVDTISLLVNKRRIEVPVRDGKFQYPVVVVDPITKISAEIPKSDARRSESITVHAAPNATTTAVILLDWGETKPAGGVEMNGLWRARSDKADEKQTKVFVRAATLPDDIPFSAFYLRNMVNGVYTFLLGYKGIAGGTPVVPKFFLTSPGTPTAREMKTMSLAGTGRTVSVRVLLPQAVLWDQDEWFTGRSEASDTITKFRDDGTTWIERKGAPVGR
jgi:hypothetical protein